MSEFIVRIKIFGMFYNPGLNFPLQSLKDYQPIQAEDSLFPYNPDDQRTLGQLCMDQLVSSFGPLTSSDVITFKQPLDKIYVDETTPLRYLVERYRCVFRCHSEICVAINLTRYAPKDD